MPPKQPALFPLEGAPVEVQPVHESQLKQHDLTRFLDSVVDHSIGLAPIYGPNLCLQTLTLSSNTRALVIRFSKPSPNHTALTAIRRLLEDTVLCDRSLIKYAFCMDKLAYALYKCFGLRISSANSLLAPQASGALAPGLVEEGLKGVSNALTKGLLTELFKHKEGKETKHEVSIRQAWLAQHAGLSKTRVGKIISFDSSDLDHLHLEIASNLYCLAIRLRELKPTVTKNDVDKDFKVGKGFLDVTSSRFKTRITQASTQQRLQLEVSHNGRTVKYHASTKKVEGRGAKIGTSGSLALAHGAKIVVRTLGREPATNAEEIRHQLLANILKGTVTTLDNPFVQTIFFPEMLSPWPTTSRRERAVFLSDRTILNASQGRAVEAIISVENRHRVVLVHGPPGTGKTTVIAAAAHSIVRSDPYAFVWLTAHSNVAVKNIAEKLVQSDILDFKIVVSKEFHFDWHEHLYHKVERNLIRTDSLPKDALSAERLLVGSRIILSTLSNLVNPNMADIARVAPMHTLIIDEASQIEVGDYLPVLNRFHNVLEKVVFIGDDKQLAPYGYEQIKELQSVFEKRHLKENAILLDTQYRMPVPIGTFISKNVYGGLLQTIHNITSHKSCRFVDVHGSHEERRGHSWVNYPEARVVIAIARQLVAQGKAFRIITPYDPQRSHIENQLKNEGLPHEDKVFNVDSFQGNESDHILLSPVRSGHKLGFLQENRRVNVMLTRCKKGMVIVTNRVFVEGAAKDTLVGKLATAMQALGDPWLQSQEIVYGGKKVF